MTAPHIIDPAGMLGEALSQASPDLMRSLLQHVINALLSADADAVCGAQWGQQDPQRHTQRNGYRYRPLDTRVGTIDVAIPKLRSGTYFPEWLLQRRKRCETALITVVADCYLAGVSTRRMDKLVKTLGITGLSKSQVSRMATDLDEHVDQFRNRPLHDAAPTTPLISCRSPPKHYGPPSKRCCTRCMTSPTRHRSTLNTTGSWTTSTTSSPLCVITSIKPGQTSSRSRPSPPGCGPRSGPITPMSASTAKSAAAPTPWESSPTDKQSSA